MESLKEKNRKRLYDIQLYGVEERFINRIWLDRLMFDFLEYDEFVKAVDAVTGSRLLEKENLKDRREELNIMLHNTARRLIVVNLALKYLSHLADVGLSEVLDLYWNDRMKRFEGFKRS